MGRAANRGPLLPYLLALLASPTPAYFGRAKLLVAGLSSVGLALLARLAWRRESPWTALWWTALLGQNVIFVWYAGRVYPETLLAVFCALSFLAFDRPTLSGFLLGLAFLCKPTAFLLVPAFVVGSLAEPIPWRSRWRGACLFTVAFLAAASPALVRNTHLFGNPFYTRHTAHEIWLESWDEIYAPEHLDSLPTAASYWATHTLGHIAARELEGMRKMTVNFVLAFEVTLQPIVPWPELSKVLAALLVVLGAVGVMRERNRAARTALAIAFVLFFLFFAWDSAVVDSPRFLVPVIPLFLLSLSRFCGKASGKRRATAVATIAGLAAWTIIRLVTRVDWHEIARDPAGLGALPRSHAEIVEWIRDRATGADVLCYGPEESLYPWITGRPTLPLLTASSPAGLEAYFTEKRVNYLILDPPSLRRRPYLEPYFASPVDGSFEPQTGHLAADFPFLTLVHETAPEPNRFLVYRVDLPSPSPAASTNRPSGNEAESSAHESG